MTEDSILRKLRRHSTSIGDDCAIIRPRPNEDLLFTTDFTIENVHFTRDQKPSAIGHRALARSLSDIAAMGGHPRYCLVSIALAPWTNARWIDAFYRGLMKLARETGTELVGGDLSHANQLTCDVMVCGSIARGKALRRSGAKAGDTIYVSGPLGGWTHKPRIVPRLDLGRKLVGKANACMDISDGLALDLHRLCVESGVAADIESVPLLPGATIEQALHDGEDYELLYTATRQVPGIPIGTIRKGRAGALTYGGKRLPPRGYDHTQHRS
jgi:thiamine-monophosphate kinase